MAISLQKGGNVNLSKEAPGLNKMVVGLGWDTRATDGAAFDLDGAIFLLNAAGKVRSDADFVFYNNLKSTDGSIVHSGDNTHRRRRRRRRNRHHRPDQGAGRRRQDRDLRHDPRSRARASRISARCRRHSCAA